MKTRNIIITCLCLLVVPLTGAAQISRLGEDIQYGASMRGSFGTGDNAPFWFSNNRYGLGPIGNNTSLARTYVKRDVETDSLKTWRIGYGADLVAGYGNQCKFSIQQAFVDVQWKVLKLSLGQKERPSELKNNELSTGGMTLGINAPEAGSPSKHTSPMAGTPTTSGNGNLPARNDSTRKVAT